MTEVTDILGQMEEGDLSAAEKLLPLVYAELLKLASARMAHENPGQTLQATGLVHEAFLRLVDVAETQRWDSRGHFFAAASEAMRRILIERARKRIRREAMSGPRLPLTDLADVTAFPNEQLLQLDEALQRLEARNAEAAELVKLRFFGGLSMIETAKVLGIPLRTAEREWTYARTWLHRELEKADG